MTQFGGNTSVRRFGAGAAKPRPIGCICTPWHRKRASYDPDCTIHNPKRKP